MKNQKKLLVLKTLVSIGGSIIGIVIAVLGSEIHEISKWTSSATFGGDFYTYIYEATQNAANNVENLIYLLTKFRYVVIAIGALIILLSVFFLLQAFSAYYDAKAKQDLINALLHAGNTASTEETAPDAAGEPIFHEENEESQKVEKVPSTWTCPVCGKANRMEVRACKCGCKRVL